MSDAIYEASKPRPTLDGVRKIVRPIPMFSRRPAAPRRAYAQPTVQSKREKRIPPWLQTLLAMPIILLMSAFLQSAILGQLAIIAYGMYAYIWRVHSRTTFILALLSMSTTILILVLRGDLTMAQNFATYTFLLLVVGVITLSRELKREGGRIYSSRQHKHY